MTEEQTKPEEKLSITIKKKEYTYEEVKRLFGILGTNERLAAIFNCTPNYISMLKESDPQFRAAIEGGKEFADGQVINALYENAVKYKDTAAQRFYLTNKVKQEFAELSKQEIKHEGIDTLIDRLSNRYDIPDEASITPIAGK